MLLPTFNSISTSWEREKEVFFRPDEYLGWVLLDLVFSCFASQNHISFKIVYFLTTYLPRPPSSLLIHQDATDLDVVRQKIQQNHQGQKVQWRLYKMIILKEDDGGCWWKGRFAYGDVYLCKSPLQNLPKFLKLKFDWSLSKLILVKVEILKQETWK